MSPQKEKRVNLTSQILRGPQDMINFLSESLNIDYTKVIQTFVMENRKIELIINQIDSPTVKGELVWIGNRKDGEEGLVICFTSKEELNFIYPTLQNVEDIVINNKKNRLTISSDSNKQKCSVCGKPIEIFDKFLSCPVCEEKAHKNHLIEWVQKEGKCPVCKKSISISRMGSLIID
ncbi:MAG: E3 ubiquitin-protein ligase [Promethearchaeota archaeon]|nr:MAG: E3 ubiquitin-protein ligase [Candidatus Lokiarchaeota archaeon]